MKRAVMAAMLVAGIAIGPAAHAKVAPPAAIVVSGGTLTKAVRLRDASVDAMLRRSSIEALITGPARPLTESDDWYLVRIYARRDGKLVGPIMELRYYPGPAGQRSRFEQRYDNGRPEGGSSWTYAAPPIEALLRPIVRTPQPRGGAGQGITIGSRTSVIAGIVISSVFVVLLIVLILRLSSRRRKGSVAPTT